MSFYLPVSCIEPGLATCFIHDILHVSMPFSQIFPPSPSLTESMNQLEHLEIHGSSIAEAWLENFEHYFASV